MAYCVLFSFFGTDLAQIAEVPPVPLCIAYGHAHNAAQTDMPEAAEMLADKRMYEKKKQMKAAAGMPG